MSNVTSVLIYQKLQVMAVEMEVTESCTLAEYDDCCKGWLCCFVWCSYTDSVSPCDPGTVIFLVKGVGWALKWDHLLSTDCLDALKLKEENLCSGSFMTMALILDQGCQNALSYAHTDRSAHSLNYWKHPSMQQMVRLASLLRLLLHYSPFSHKRRHKHKMWKGSV